MFVYVFRWRNWNWSRSSRKWNPNSLTVQATLIKIPDWLSSSKYSPISFPVSSEISCWEPNSGFPRLTRCKWEHKLVWFPNFDATMVPYRLVHCYILLFLSGFSFQRFPDFKPPTRRQNLTPNIRSSLALLRKKILYLNEWSKISVVFFICRLSMHQPHILFTIIPTISFFSGSTSDL